MIRQFVFKFIHKFGTQENLISRQAHKSHQISVHDFNLAPKPRRTTIFRGPILGAKAHPAPCTNGKRTVHSFLSTPFNNPATNNLRKGKNISPVP